MVPFSVLDLSNIVQGGTAGEALHRSRELARHVEQLGYKRFWLAEHHNMTGIASAATAVVIGHVAAGTTTIRVGSGGIMLPNHAPLVIAEQFGTLATLFPGFAEKTKGIVPAGATRLDQENMRRQQDALWLAEWFKQRPEVDRVLHPALPDCPGHDIWRRDFTGASSIFSIVMKQSSDAAVSAMLDGYRHFGIGFSYGGFESLVLPSNPSGVRTATTWAGPLIRFHAGLEDADDLIADLEAGLERFNAAL